MLIMIILMLGSIPFSFDPLIIPCSFNGVTKFKNDFPNWFQEWWLFFGAIPKIFCSQIKHVYYYFKEHAMGLIPTPSSQTIFFTSQFQIPLILCWDFVQTQMIQIPFLVYLVREFKVKWWLNFSPSTFQQLSHIKN